MHIQFEHNEAAQVTILTASEAKGPTAAHVLAYTENRMTISTAAAAAVRAALKIETSRYILMGQALDVRQNGIIVIHIQHALKREDVKTLQSRWV